MTSHRRFANFNPPTKIAYINGKPKTLHLRRCRLVVHGASAPREQIFDQSVITLGAMADNDLVVEEDTVSRYHGKIVQEEAGYILQDLGSTNGSFINGVQIREAFLLPGGDFHLGQCRVSFYPYDEKVEIQPSALERFGDIIGRNIRMREIFGMLEKIAPTNATVVIEGETGTGKEVVAQTIHKMSQRRDKPFIVFDCGAVPESLIESELFGHEKGSFTGAIMARQGLFEMAQGGTIFLDELGELSIDLQPKLLRVLEQREIRRVGSSKSIPINVRVIAATNRNLEDEVRAGRFREDLFYRLSVVRLMLPPLRERREDIPLLIEHFLRAHAYNRDERGNPRITHVSPAALALLLPWHWPGNIRELVNVIERGVSFADGATIEPEDLPEALRHHAPPRPDVRATLSPDLLDDDDDEDDDGDEPDAGALAALMGAHPDELNQKTFKEAKEAWIQTFERDYIVALLERNDNNISHAAREADIDRKYFRKLMKKYEVEVK